VWSIPAETPSEVWIYMKQLRRLVRKRQTEREFHVERAETSARAREGDIYPYGRQSMPERVGDGIREGEALALLPKLKRSAHCQCRPAPSLPLSDSLPASTRRCVYPTFSFSATSKREGGGGGKKVGDHDASKLAMASPDGQTRVER
jgi:hypothetical protein